MNTKKTKTAAIEYARKNVSALYRFGGGWKYNRYDAKVNARRECSQPDYWQAMASRSRSLLRYALEYMGYGWQGQEMGAYDLQNNGGKWTDYIPDTTEIDD